MILTISSLKETDARLQGECCIARYQFVLTATDVLASIVDVLQYTVHDDLTTVTFLVELDAIASIYRFAIPRQIAIGLHLVKIEISSPKLSHTTIMVESGNIGGSRSLVDILQEIVATIEVGPCAIRPTRHLVGIEIWHQQRASRASGKIVASTATTIRQVLCARNHIYIKSVGIECQLALVGKELARIQLIGRFLV